MTHSTHVTGFARAMLPLPQMEPVPDPEPGLSAYQLYCWMRRNKVCEAHVHHAELQRMVNEVEIAEEYAFPDQSIFSFTHEHEFHLKQLWLTRMENEVMVFSFAACKPRKADRGNFVYIVRRIQRRHVPLEVLR